MNAKQLLDSRKFCLLMDDLARTWKDKKATDEDREMRLEAVLGQLNPEQYGVLYSTKGLDKLRSQLFLPKAIASPVKAEVQAIAKAKRAYKKRRPMVDDNEPQATDKKALLDAMRAPLTPAEALQLRKEAEANKQRDPQLVVNDAVEQVIKPNWATTPQTEGMKHFHVWARRNDEHVSFDPQKWKIALALHKIPCGQVTFKPEGLGMSEGNGMTGGGMETSKSGNVWRVIIG